MKRWRMKKMWKREGRTNERRRKRRGASNEWEAGREGGKSASGKRRSTPMASAMGEKRGGRGRRGMLEQEERGRKRRRARSREERKKTVGVELVLGPGVASVFEKGEVCKVPYKVTIQGSQGPFCR
jgi:hypothetical protein